MRLIVFFFKVILIFVLFLQLMAMHSTEVGVTMFKAETLQCRVSFNPQTLQSLHLKLTPNPDYKDQWTNEELQVIERYFDAKAKKITFFVIIYFQSTCVLLNAITYQRNVLKLVCIYIVGGVCSIQAQCPLSLWSNTECSFTNIQRLYPHNAFRDGMFIFAFF